MKKDRSEDFIKPRHCFCHYALDELKKWAMKRYRENYGTTELLSSTQDPHEKELISIVSLLDVDKDTLLSMMGDVRLPEHHILHCHRQLRKMLSQEGVIHEAHHPESGH